MRTRIWKPGRIAALLIIALAVAGLVHTKRAHPAGWVAVPNHAQPGQLTMKPCTYPTEKGDLPADCGTLTVPENRADPKSRLIAVPVTRIRSQSRHPAEPVFRLEGGPGRTNMDFPFASRYVGNRDLVLVGYRGVDGSARLDCQEVSDARRHTADLLSDSALDASAKAMRACAQRLTNSGYDLAGYTIAERVDDLDAAREAMGYDRVDLLSESFGTRVALIYAWRHPESIKRSVMIGVNPPGHFIWKPGQTDEQLRRLSALCGSTCVDQFASMQRTQANFPKRWGPFGIHRGNAEVASFFGLMDSSTNATPISGPMTLDAWRAADHGDASGLWFQSLASALLFPRVQVWGDSAAMARIDAATAVEHFKGNATSVIGDPGNRFLWAGGALTDAWPAAPGESTYARTRDSDVPMLLISGEFDGTTPAVNATRDLLPHLSNGHQVLLKGFGHTTDFWSQQVGAGNHLINGYLDSGTVDASRYVPQKIDFTPSTRQTTLAKEARRRPDHDRAAQLALAAVDGPSRPYTRSPRSRDAGARSIGVGVRDRSRRLVRRLPHRADRAAERSARRRAAGRLQHGRPDRRRGLPRLAHARPDPRPHGRPHRGLRGCPDRRMAGLPQRDRAAGARDDARGRGGRHEPRADRERHRGGVQASPERPRPR